MTRARAIDFVHLYSLDSSFYQNGYRRAHSLRGVRGVTFLFFHRVDSLTDARPAPPPPAAVCAAWKQRGSGNSSDATRCARQSKFANASRPLENLLAWPRDGAAAFAGSLTAFREMIFSRKNRAILKLFRGEDILDRQIFFLCLTVPMQETLGEEGSGDSKPRRPCFFPGSEGRTGRSGPERPLRSILSLPGLKPGLVKEKEVAFGKNFTVFLPFAAFSDDFSIETGQPSFFSLVFAEYAGKRISSRDLF